VIVVDANVLVHLHLPAEGRAVAEALLQSDPQWAAPVLWRSEFRNTLAKYLRCGGLTLDLALRIQGEAEDLMSGEEYDVDSDTVLRLAERSGCSAYDCEYVALAKHLGVRLVTRDAQVLRAFPEAATPL
jgi:predicted nucleic acid-binding protein